MIEFIKSNKLLVIKLIIVAGGLVSYKIFFLSSDTSAPLTSSADVASSPASQNLLAVLTNLKTIHLDSSIFTSQAFTSLNDFGVEIAKEPVGRDNPFVPYVGILPPSTASSATSSTILKLPLGKLK